MTEAVTWTHLDMAAATGIAVLGAALFNPAGLGSRQGVVKALPGGAWSASGARDLGGHMKAHSTTVTSDGVETIHVGSERVGEICVEGQTLNATRARDGRVLLTKDRRGALEWLLGEDDAEKPDHVLAAEEALGVVMGRAALGWRSQCGQAFVYDGGAAFRPTASGQPAPVTISADWSLPDHVKPRAVHILARAYFELLELAERGGA